jgi:hypothetical protein
MTNVTEKERRIPARRTKLNSRPAALMIGVEL